MCDSLALLLVTILVLFIPSAMAAFFVALTLRREGSLADLTTDEPYGSPISCCEAKLKKWVIVVEQFLSFSVCIIFIGVEANSETADDGCSVWIYILAGISILCSFFSCWFIFKDIRKIWGMNGSVTMDDKETGQPPTLTDNELYHGVPMRF